MLDLNWFLFAVFPYIAVALAVIVTIERFKNNQYNITSHSSQFLENKQAFWGLTLWHWGMLPVLILHIFVFIAPGAWTKLVAEPIRLYMVEIIGAGLGITTLVGIGILCIRRLTDRRMRAVSKSMDFFVLFILFLQILSGVIMAFMYKWGASWAPHTAVPWLWSLIKLQPDLNYITTMPHLVKFHMFNAFVLISLIPFTKLIHFLTFPFKYLIRPPQVTIWNLKKKSKYN